MVNTDKDRHLTTEQLSAYLDRQLSQAEQAACKAHIESCQQCQGALAGLRQTVALLRSMPQPPVPRSFALPTGVTYLQEPAARQVEPAHPRRRWPIYVRRSLRAMSTIAAVIGFIFLLSGILPLLMHGGGATTATSSTAAPASGNATQPQLQATNNAAATTGPAKPATNDKTTPGRSPTPGKTPTGATASPAVADHQNNQTTSQAPPAPPIIDLNDPLVRQEVGFTLLILGVVGVLVTRRWRSRRT